LPSSISPLHRSPIQPLDDSSPIHRRVLELPSHSEGERTVSNVLIVDDHILFAERLAVGLGRVLADDPEKPGDFPIFAYATSVAEALRIVSVHRPFDLAVVDLILPDGDGTTVVREIKRRSPGTPVAVLTARQDLSEALAAGADEAIPKRTGLARIVASLSHLAGIPDQPGTQDA
jgi:DNA-binding NarL/FixJ family response regulator